MNEPTATRRRPGRRPGASDTRDRILAAARAIFGEHGFDGTTIRAIASTAEVDAALVHHYFGSKQQLFVAAMELPVDLGEAAPRLMAGPPEELGARIVRFVLELWGTPATRSLMLGVVRSASTDPSAAAMLRRILAEGPFAALAQATDRPDAALRANLVGSQLVGLAMARHIVAVEPLASASDDTIARAVGPTLTRYLIGDIAPPDPPRVPS